MVGDRNIRKDGSGIPAAREARGRSPLLRWFASAATMNVPQAAGPVAFSLLALSLSGDTGGGAAMILAMTLAQVAGAVPITRLGRAMPAARVLKLLVLVRTLALAAVAWLAACEASFPWLVAAAALAGSVNGAAYGYLRSVLNELTAATGLPRALGIAATLNETTFVLAPVLASGLGTFSPVCAVLAVAILGAVPALLIPDVGPAQVGGVPLAVGSAISRSILLWLSCAMAGGAAVAAVEIGAVALALKFGFEPALAILFTVPLCLASAAGGLWVSVRNRMATRRVVAAQLSVMTVGSALVAFGTSIVATVLGAVLIGAVLAPLGTHYSLILDRLAPPHRRPEVFALLRTANAIGVIAASALLTVASLSSALVAVAVLMLAVTTTVALASRARS